MLDTIEQYVDQYLKSAGFEMTSREFYLWKNSIDNQKMEEDKGRKKGQVSNSISKGKIDRRKLVEQAEWKETLHYRRTCKSYQ